MSRQAEPIPGKGFEDLDTLVNILLIDVQSEKNYHRTSESLQQLAFEIIPRCEGASAFEDLDRAFGMTGTNAFKGIHQRLQTSLNWEIW